MSQEREDYADPQPPRPTAGQVVGCIVLIGLALAIALVLAFLALQGELAPA